MDRLGFQLRPAVGQIRAQIELAQQLEAWGYPFVYLPSRGASLVACQALLHATERLQVGTSIVRIYDYAPTELATSAALLHELSGGRFHLGLGVGHQAAVEWLDVPLGPPVADMRSYVERLRGAVPAGSLPPLLLAALRRRMVRLAGEVADGVLLANAALSHLATMLKQIPAGRPDFVVGNVISCAVADDRPTALAAVQRRMRVYLSLPNYQEYFSQVGYGEEVEQARAALAAGDRDALSAAFSERMADDITLFGTAADVRERLEAWWAAGLTRISLGATMLNGAETDAIYQVAAALR